MSIDLSTPIIIKRKRVMLRPCTPVFSDADADLRAIPWGMTNNGYAHKSRKHAHRIVMIRMVGRSLGRHELVDHFNRNKLDNRRSNLRLVTSMQNNQNQKLQLTNTSGYRGVSYHKLLGKWEAYISHKGKKVFGGCFPTAKEAAAKAAQMRKDYSFHNWRDD